MIIPIQECPRVSVGRGSCQQQVEITIAIEVGQLKITIVDAFDAIKPLRVAPIPVVKPDGGERNALVVLDAVALAGIDKVEIPVEI